MGCVLMAVGAECNTRKLRSSGRTYGTSNRFIPNSGHARQFTSGTLAEPVARNSAICRWAALVIPADRHEAAPSHRPITSANDYETEQAGRGIAGILMFP